MKFPRLFAYVAKIERSKLFWSKAHLDSLDDYCEIVNEYETWKRHMGVKKPLRTLDLLRFLGNGQYADEIRKLFLAHNQYGQVKAFFARREHRKNRVVGDRARGSSRVGGFSE